MNLNAIYTGDALDVLRTLPDKSASCGVTSPPYYGLRNYGVAGQVGREDTPEQYIERLVAIFHEFKRVLANDGTLWVNIGDTYWGKKGTSGESSHAYQAARYAAGVSFNRPCSNTGVVGVVGPRQGNHPVIKRKDLIGIPWMFAFAMRADGWYLRQEIIWHKPNPMPESVRDRCTNNHESLFLFTKKEKYYFDNKAILEPYTQPLKRWAGNDLKANGHSKWAQATGQNAYRDRNMRPNPAGRNKRSVWSIPTRSFHGAHSATYPEALIVDCIKAGCPPGGVVLDMFMGAGTTAVVARKQGRQYVGIELNPEYVKIANERVEKVGC
jgi:DNA modification methylase